MVPVSFPFKIQTSKKSGFMFVGANGIFWVSSQKIVFVVFIVDNQWGQDVLLGVPRDVILRCLFKYQLLFQIWD